MGNTVRKRDMSSSAATSAAMPAKPGKPAKKKRGNKPLAVPAPPPPLPRPGALQRTSQVQRLLEQLPPPPDPEEQAFSYLRRTLREDFDTFLLNNLLLTVRFFENFEAEIRHLRIAPLSESEARCNSELFRHHRYCVWPDKLLEHVAEHVAFKPKHGPTKNHIEALSSRRMMVLHNNVEAIEGTEGNNSFARYSSYDLSMMSSKHKGYVKLRSTSTPNKRRVSYELIESRKLDDTIYAEHSDTVTSVDVNHTRDEVITNRFRPLLLHSPPHTITSPTLSPLPLPPEIRKDGTCPDVQPFQSPGEEALNELGKRVEKFGNVMPGAKLELPHVTPVLQVTEPHTSRPKHKLGPQDPDSEITMAMENRISARKLSGTGRPMRYHLLPNTNLKPAKSQSDLDHIDRKTDRSRLSPPSSESSGYKSISPHRSNPSSRGSDSDYGYSTITELKTPRPVHSRRLGLMPEESCCIPSQCFIKVEVPTIQTGTYDDSGSESDEIYSKSHSSQKRNRKLYDEHYYLNSTLYMASFADIFVEKISEALGFMAQNVELAEMQGDKIYCDTMHSLTEKSNTKIRMDVTPSIHCKSWPFQAIEWRLRQREHKLDRNTNITYTWPTNTMIANVQKMGCHILPIGYTPTHGSNSENHAEWQIAFPEAESYLEQRLSHPQIFCFLFTLALHKNFLEPLVKSELKLLPAHIRSVLFWQCEKDYAIWNPEDRLGESLLRLLDAVYDCLKKRKLPDYFVKDHNKFESIPNRDLSTMQEKLHSIIENPVKYALITVRNLYYISKEGQDAFYPKFDYKKLDDIISTDNYASFFNPLLIPSSVSKNVDAEEDSSGEEDESYDRERQWHKDVRRDLDAKKAARKITKARKSSSESINVKLPPQKNDQMRSKLILELFIPHFLRMAEYSNKYRVHKQATFYLKHSERLTRLLSELTVSEKDVCDKFMAQIKSEQKFTRDNGRSSTNNQKLLRPIVKSNESSTDKSPTFPRKYSENDIAIVEVHRHPKRVVSIELPAEIEESSEL